MDSTKQKTSIMVVDDHTLFRQGLISLLHNEESFEVIAEAENGQKALDLLKVVKPDIILLDLNMPKMNGRETLMNISSLYPQISVIILTMHSGALYENDLRQLGAHSFLTKGADSGEIIQAINAVGRKGYYYTPNFPFIYKPQISDSHRQMALTTREKEILIHLCSNKTNKFISESLNVSENTVRFHRKNIYSKTGVTSLTDLIKYALKNGYISLD